MPTDERERAGLEAWLREVLSDLAGPVQRMRLLLFPIVLAIVLATLWVDPAPWRAAIGLAAMVGLAALSAGSWWRWRSGLAGSETFSVNAVLMAWFQLLVIGITGGLESPLVPVLPVVALQVALTFGAHPVRAFVLGGQLAALAVFAACELAGVHLGLPGIARYPGPSHVLLTTGVLVGMVLVATALGARVRGVVAAVVARASAAAEGERRAHAEHARDLLLLSAEIAHELKNPLASVKGLAALLAKDLAGRDAERLSVLRDEVERMRETLEAFLDFSRPIAPLVLEPVDLAGLAHEVAALCEGLARQRGVAVRATGAGTVTADRRKLRQVLVNLAQNAIDAAPPGTEVELAAGPAWLEVRDRGPGVSAELAARAFEPGVTDKPHGSGLGLTIARALVRQHGGDLSLSGREGGGTVARAELRPPG